MKKLSAKYRWLIAGAIWVIILVGIWHPFARPNKQSLADTAKSVLDTGPIEKSFDSTLYLGETVIKIKEPTLVFTGEKAKLKVRVAMKSLPSMTDRIDPTNFVIQTAQGKICLPMNADNIYTFDDNKSYEYSVDFQPGQQLASADSYTKALFDHVLFYDVPIKATSTYKVLLIDGLEYTDGGKLEIFATFKD